MPQDFLLVLNTPFSFLFFKKYFAPHQPRYRRKSQPLIYPGYPKMGGFRITTRCFQQTKALHVRPPQRYSAPMNLGQWPPQIHTPTASGGTKGDIKSKVSSAKISYSLKETNWLQHLKWDAAILLFAGLYVNWYMILTTLIVFHKLEHRVQCQFFQALRLYTIWKPPKTMQHWPSARDKVMFESKSMSFLLMFVNLPLRFYQQNGSHKTAKRKLQRGQVLYFRQNQYRTNQKQPLKKETTTKTLHFCVPAASFSKC